MVCSSMWVLCSMFTVLIFLPKDNFAVVSSAFTIDQFSCQSDHCSWIDDQFNRDAHWRRSLEPLSKLSPFCIVANRKEQTVSARFISQWLGNHDSFQSSICIHFSFMMFSSNSAAVPTLSMLKRNYGSCVQLQRNDKGLEVRSLNCDASVLWSAKGRLTSSSSKWVAVSVTLDAATDFKLILEGTIPAGNPDARICVDNITAFNGPCHELASAAYTETLWNWLEPILLVFAGAFASALLIPLTVWAVRTARSRRGTKQPPTPPNRDSLHQAESLQMYADHLGSGNSAVPVGHGRPRRPPPSVPGPEVSLDERFADNTGVRPARPPRARDPPPRYEEAMGLLASGSDPASSDVRVMDHKVAYIV